MKKFTLVLLAIFLATTLAANPGNCPKKGDFGLLLTIPGYTGESIEAYFPMYSLGISYNLTDTVLLRPRLLFNYIVNDQSGTDPTEKYFIMGLVINTFFTLQRTSSVTLYLGPELKYASSDNGDRKGKGSTIVKATLNLGVQYNFSRSFAVYSELTGGMLRYSSFSSSGDTHDLQFGAFGASAGLVIYL